MAKLPPKRPLPWRPGRTTSCVEEEPPLSASATVAFEDDAVGLVLGAMANLIRGSNKGTEEEVLLLNFISKCVRRRRGIFPNVAFYRLRDSQRYAAYGPMNAAANLCSTRGTESL